MAVVDTFITRIKEVNPLLNAVIADRFEEARKEAAELDRVLDSGNLPEELSEQNAPYLGVPFTAKEAVSIAGNSVCLKLYSLLHLVWHEPYDADVNNCTA